VTSLVVDLVPLHPNKMLGGGGQDSCGPCTVTSKICYGLKEMLLIMYDCF
jgi:hypothetical protein